MATKKNNGTDDGSGVPPKSNNTQITVNECQSYEKFKYGKGMMCRYFFTGPLWAEFFGMFKSCGIPTHMLSLFIGAQIHGKLITMAGTFPHSIWVQRYAALFDGYTFEPGIKPVYVRLMDDDTLQYFINGQSFDDHANVITQPKKPEPSQLDLYGQ